MVRGRGKPCWCFQGPAHTRSQRQAWEHHKHVIMSRGSSHVQRFIQLNSNLSSSVCTLKKKKLRLQGQQGSIIILSILQVGKLRHWQSLWPLVPAGSALGHLAPVCARSHRVNWVGWKKVVWETPKLRTLPVPWGVWAGSDQLVGEGRDGLNQPSWGSWVELWVQFLTLLSAGRPCDPPLATS